MPAAFQTTATIFLLVTVLLFVTKPATFFEPNGQIKSFGTETPVTLVMFLYGLLLMVYLFALYILD